MVLVNFSHQVKNFRLGIMISGVLDLSGRLEWYQVLNL
jgi:hypothetical protein